MKKKNNNNQNQNRPPPEWESYVYSNPFRKNGKGFFFSRSSIIKHKTTRARADRLALRKMKK